MFGADEIISSFANRPADWRVTPAQCLMKNGSMRVWLRDGLNGYSSGANMTCDDGPEWPEEKRIEFASLWEAAKRRANVPTFPYPHRTVEEVEAEQSLADRAKNMKKWSPIKDWKPYDAPFDWDGKEVVYRNGGIGRPFRWGRYKMDALKHLDVMYYFTKCSND